VAAGNAKPTLTVAQGPAVAHNVSWLFAYEDYAVIGDCETAALVGRNGSMTGYAGRVSIPGRCSPRCSAVRTTVTGRSPQQRGAHVSRPIAKYAHLETDIETEDGAATLIDFMPLRREGTSTSFAWFAVDGYVCNAH
jgi:hypothetical protein